jgi:hypothetical protein
LRPLLTPMICFLALCSIKNYFHLTWMVACCCCFFTNDFFKGCFYFLHRLFTQTIFASHHHICLWRHAKKSCAVYADAHHSDR